MAKKQKFASLIGWLHTCSYLVYDFGEISDDDRDRVSFNSVELTFFKHYAGHVCCLQCDLTGEWVAEITRNDGLIRLRYVYSPVFGSWEDALKYAKGEVDGMNAAAERVRNNSNDGV